MTYMTPAAGSLAFMDKRYQLTSQIKTRCEVEQLTWDSQGKASWLASISLSHSPGVPSIQATNGPCELVARYAFFGVVMHVQVYCSLLWGMTAPSTFGVQLDSTRAL